MKSYLYPAFLLFLLSCSSKESPTENKSIISSVATTENEVIANNDSSSIATASVIFYRWYLSEIKRSSIKGGSFPDYVWVNSIAKLETDRYFQSLKSLDVASEEFINSEKQRFEVCQASLEQIAYKAVEECGCSVSEFTNECDFLDYYYWISSQELFDGCIVENVSFENTKGTCDLKFYFISNSRKVISKNFSAKVHFIKQKEKWLIKEIERRISPA